MSLGFNCACDAPGNLSVLLQLAQDVRDRAWLQKEQVVQSLLNVNVAYFDPAQVMNLC